MSYIFKTLLLHAEQSVLKTKNELLNWTHHHAHLTYDYQAQHYNHHHIKKIDHVDIPPHSWWHESHFFRHTPCCSIRFVSGALWGQMDHLKLFFMSLDLFLNSFCSVKEYMCRSASAMGGGVFWLFWLWQPHEWVSRVSEQQDGSHCLFELLVVLILQLISVFDIARIL